MIVPGGRQHLKALGPGHCPDSVIPDAQFDSNRQFPSPSVPHAVLEQHFMSAGVPGQAPDMNVPPLLVQAEVEIQTPGASSAPVHGSLTERAPRTISDAVATEKRTASINNSNIMTFAYSRKECSGRLYNFEKEPR